MKDTIYRADAIEAVCGAVIDEFDVSPTRGYEVAEHALSALPSAEAVSMEEHIKELNDLAVEWKAKFAKAEKITDEIYDETMAKVAKECEECKERLRNIRPSAEAEPKWNCTANFVEEQLEKLKDMTYEERIKLLHILFPSDDAEPSLKAIKRQIGEHWYLDPPSAEAAHGWIPCSERLPSYDGRYLVCMDWEYDNVAVLKWADGWNCYRDYDGKISRESEIDGADIIAWMPLPKPYKGGDDK